MVTGVLTLLQVGVAVLLRTSAESVSVSLTLPGAPFPHYWERCIGSGHGALTLREDWRRHVAMAHADLGIQRVRFHGILDDDMSVSFSPNETGFVNVDSTCDFLVAHNMSMVMELGFMPRWLARNKTFTDLHRPILVDHCSIESAHCIPILCAHAVSRC